MTGIEKKWCSQKAWLWAASTVCSRTMHVPFCSAGALTPFGDLHNYHHPPPPHYPDIGQWSHLSTISVYCLSSVLCKPALHMLCLQGQRPCVCMIWIEQQDCSRHAPLFNEVDAFSVLHAAIHRIAAVACCADSLICSVEGISGSNEGAATQDDADFGDGGYHEDFREYCLYARKR